MKNQPALHGRDHLLGGSDPIPGLGFAKIYQAQLNGGISGLATAGAWTAFPWDVGGSAIQPPTGVLATDIFVYDDDTFTLTITPPPDGASFVAIQGSIIWSEALFTDDPDTYDKASVLSLTASGNPILPQNGSSFNPYPSSTSYAPTGSGFFKTDDIYIQIGQQGVIDVQLFYMHNAGGTISGHAYITAYVIDLVSETDAQFQQPIGTPF